jgi:hypothetical protein
MQGRDLKQRKDFIRRLDKGLPFARRRPHGKFCSVKLTRLHGAPQKPAICAMSKTLKRLA